MRGLKGLNVGGVTYIVRGLNVGGVTSERAEGRMRGPRYDIEAGDCVIEV